MSEIIEHVDPLPKKDETQSETSKIFARNLRDLMARKGYKRPDLQKYLNVSYSAVTWWVHGDRIPRADMLDKIAKLFNVPVSRLFSVGKQEDTKETQKVPDLLLGHRKEFWESLFILDKLPKDKQKTALIFLKGLQAG